MGIVSEATLEKARQWGREDANDAIIIAREAPTEIDKNTYDLGDFLGTEYASDRPGKPARRLASQWDQIHETLANSGRLWGVDRSRPVAALLPEEGKLGRRDWTRATRRPRWKP